MKPILVSLALVLLASPVAAEVARSQLAYLERWRAGTPLSQVIVILGPPDFVTLATDRTDSGAELREVGISREVGWKVRGCGPVRMHVDRRGRTIGADYSSLKNPQLFCSPEMERLLTPPAAQSCSRADRLPHCR